MLKIERVVAAALAGVAMPTVAAQDAVQWRVEDGGNGHWYMGVSGVISWNEASQRATSAGGYLATFPLPGELAFVGKSIFDVSEDLFYSDWGPHIGGFQDLGSPDYSEPVGGWEWITGEPLVCVERRCDSIQNRPQHHLAIWRGYGTYTYNDTMYDDATLAQPGYVIEWSADCNDDGIVDYGQILDGTYPDENGNGVPDCCDEGVGCDCPADITGDGQVDAADLGVLLAVWNTDGGAIPAADINGDGTVNASDLGLLLGSWGLCS